MKLRELQQKDCEFMLEWMHDESVVKDLHANFAEKTIQDCKEFISYCMESKSDLHLAITNDTDEYMGTVSLKHIDVEKNCAEFAITVRSCAMGKGYSIYGMKEIIKLGHEKYGLKNIYWCVADYNTRAVRFYDKNKFERTKDIPEFILNNYPEKLQQNLIWYVA